MENRIVLGLFKTIFSANSLVEKLEELGYNNDQISIITKEDVAKNGKVKVDNDISEGVKEGAKTGGTIGGVLGLLAGLGVLAIPGIGALFISGPLLAAAGITGVAGATASGAITGALAGGLVAFLKELGVDELQAKEIENKLNNNYILVGVVTNEDKSDDLKELFESHDSENTMDLEMKEQN